jgi:hypothetical protein
MRTLIALSLVTAALSLNACKSGDKSSADASSGASATVETAIKTQIGGQIVPVGKHRVEVRLFKHGHADAIVTDANGAPVADLAKCKLTLRAKARGNADARTAIDLVYQPATARLSGRAAGNVELEPAPVDVELTVGDANASAKLDAPILLVGPEIGGTLVAAGKYGVELAAHADGSLEALVHDAAGARLTADAKLDLALNGQAGTPAIRFTWDAPRALFVARADAAAKLAMAPVTIGIDGSAVAQLPKLALSVEAKHGGHVIVAGDYSVELVAKGGAVSAFVFDATGAASAKADLDLALQVGGGAFVKLVWDPPSLSYRADLREQFDFEASSITLALKADGKVFVGARAPSLKVDAKVAAKAALDAKANVNVKAPSLKAAADVKVPKVDVHKSASASAGANGNTGASAKAQAGFSLGTR